MNIEALMQDIEKVDWARLEHAYGPASDVPEMLRKTLSPDPEVREEAWEEFWGSVVHQGTRYPATAEVARVLIPWLEQPDHPSLLEVWGFLTELVSGGYSPEPLPDGAQGWHTDAVQARQAALEGWPIYLRHADSSRPEVRRAAYGALAHLYEQVNSVFPALERRYALEEGSNLKGAVLIAQATLLRPQLEREPRKVIALKGVLEGLTSDEGAPLELRSDAVRAWGVLEPLTFPANEVELAVELVMRQPERFVEPSLGYWFYPLTKTFEQRPDLKRRFLERLLEHPIAGVRSSAASELCTLATEQRPLRAPVTQTLLSLLGRESDEGVRAGVVWALGRLGVEAQRQAVPALLEALQAASEKVRLNAACALAKLKDARAIPTLLELLESDSLKTLFSVAWAFHEFDALPQEATLPFLAALRRLRLGKPYQDFEGLQFSQSLEEARAEVWSDFLYRTERLTSHEDAVIEELTRALDDPTNWRVMAIAARCLGERKARQAIPALIRAAANVLDNDPSGYCAILDAFQAIGDEGVVETLLEDWPPPLEEHHLQRVEGSFIRTLATLGGPKVLPFLERFEPSHPTTREELDRLRWALRGKPLADFAILLYHALESKRWVALEPLLEHIQPGTAEASLVLPVLYEMASDFNRGHPWELFGAAHTLLNFSGDRGPLEAVARWFDEPGYGRSASSHLLEHISDLGEHLVVFRPVLERLAYAERYQTGSYSSDTVKEDEALQNRALALLQQLERA